MERCGSARSPSCARTSKATRKPRPLTGLSRLVCRRSQLRRNHVSEFRSAQSSTRRRSCSSVLSSAWGHRERHGRDARRMMRNGPRSGASAMSAPHFLSPLRCRPAPRSWASRCRNRTWCSTRTAKRRKQTHLKRPGRFSRLSGLEKGGSVPCWRATWNCSGVSCFFHSSSLFVDRDWDSYRSTFGRNRAFDSIISGRPGTIGKSTLSTRPAIGATGEKSACNSARAAVETAEIAELRTFVS